jgi:hypothetical protein
MTLRVCENQILQGPVFKPLQWLRELLIAQPFAPPDSGLKAALSDEQCIICLYTRIHLLN